MKSLHIIAIAPIEFFSKRDADGFFDHLPSIENNTIGYNRLTRICTIAKDLTDSKFNFKQIKNEKSENIYSGLEGSSVCFIIVQKITDFKCDEDGLKVALTRRRTINQRCVKDSIENPIYEYIKNYKKKLKFELDIIPSYVFTFFCVFGCNFTEYETKLIKLMSSPAKTGIDDTSNRDEFNNSLVHNSNVDSILDYDQVEDSSVYISWSTISCSLSLEKKEHACETEALLIALETRLQVIWNRCYAFSQLAEKAFEDEIIIPDADDLNITFARTIDDAQAVLSSRISQRATAIFEGMIETSRVKDEIKRLESKLKIMKYYVDSKADKVARKYRKTVEAALFAIASLSLLEWGIGYPVFVGIENYKLLISLGYFLIIIILSIALFRKS